MNWRKNYVFTGFEFKKKISKVHPRKIQNQMPFIFECNQSAVKFR